jgi:hypothetical protein
LAEGSDAKESHPETARGEGILPIFWGAGVETLKNQASRAISPTEKKSRLGQKTLAIGSRLVYIGSTVGGRRWRIDQETNLIFRVIAVSSLFQNHR